MSQVARIAHFTFNLPLKRHELPLWRTAFLHMFPPAVGLEGLSPLEGTYPLIQFCRIGKQAGIVAINEGVQAIKQSIAAQSWSFRWQNKEYSLGIEQIDTFNHPCTVLEKPQNYLIEAYLPFTGGAKNDIAADLELSLLAQVQVLQQRVNEHLQHMTEQLALDFPYPIHAQLTHLDRSKFLSRSADSPKVYYLKCKSNLSLPAMLGIGEGMAIGLGRIIPL
ncbi:hypothetical protein [Haliscomenobacter sp.]|uniref:hypothetical protein n=1 Tax=Haliscomenobacter sp. TaxID=2717303 RepID=UPI00359367DD